MSVTQATTTTRPFPATTGTIIRLTATPIQATATPIQATAMAMAITDHITGVIGARAGALLAESIGAGPAGSREQGLTARLGTKDLLGGGEFLAAEAGEVVRIVGRDRDVARVRRPTRSAAHRACLARNASRRRLAKCRRTPPAPDLATRQA